MNKKLNLVQMSQRRLSEKDAVRVKGGERDPYPLLCPCDNDPMTGKQRDLTAMYNYSASQTGN